MYKGLIKFVLSSLLLAASAVSPFTGAWAADLLYTDSLDTGVFGDIAKEGGCYPFSFAITNEKARSGTNSLRVINDGTKACQEGSGEMKHRAEIQWDTNKIYSKLNSPYWFGFSIFIPNDYPTKAQNSDAAIVAQWMGGSYGPELWFQIVGGDSMAILRSWSTGANDSKHTDRLANIPIERGVWTDYVVYRERSWNNDGVTKIWKNGKNIVNFVGPTAINYEANNNSGNIKFKTGIYWGTATRSVQYTLYFDSIRMTDVSNGYDLVAPNNSALSQPGVPTGLQITIQ